MILKQSTPSSCGLYAVANALDMPEFVTDERMLLSIDNGGNVGVLNRWMQFSGLSLYLQPLYFDVVNDMPSDYLHKMFGLMKSVKPFSYAPILLTVQRGEISHMIAGHILPDGKFVIIDSVTGVFKIDSLMDITSVEPKIVAVYAFCDLHTGQYAFIA